MRAVSFLVFDGTNRPTLCARVDAAGVSAGWSSRNDRALVAQGQALTLLADDGAQFDRGADRGFRVSKHRLAAVADDRRTGDEPEFGLGDQQRVASASGGPESGLNLGIAQRLSSSALPTTLTLLNAIAAPASMGLSRPNAASGMPTTL